MRRGDLLLGALAASLVIFVATSVRPGKPPAAAPAAAESPVEPQGAALAGAPDSAARLAVAGATAADSRRRISELGAETYLREMLADGDSLLTRWRDRSTEPLRTWVQPGMELPDWRPEYPLMASSVFDEWSAAGFPVRFLFVRDSAEAEVHVVWTQRFPEGRQLGLTMRQASQEGWIRSAVIAIATHDSAGTPLRPELVRATARHEVGHALGLNHVPDPESVMHPTATSLVIGPRDRSTLRMLYLLPAGSLKGR